MTQEENKKLLLIDDHELLEVSNIVETNSLNKKEDNYNKLDKKDKPDILMRDGQLAQVIYDQDTKVLITASLREYYPCVKITRYPPLPDWKDVVTYQANHLGVKTLKATFDMTHLFSAGKDKCLFIFQINNISKIDKRDETLETDLILVRKEDLDKEALDLKTRLDKIDSDITKEEESFARIKNDLENERSINESILKKEKETFTKQKTDLDTKISQEKELYEQELEVLRKDHSMKMEDLLVEHDRNKQAKDRDKQKESENLDKEKNKDSNQKIQMTKRLNDEIKTLTETHEKKINELDKDIKILEGKKQLLNNDIEVMKEDLFERNDTTIGMKRFDLEKLRKEYENIDNVFKVQKNKLQEEYNKKRELIKTKESKKTKEYGEFLNLQQDNDKLDKQINELKNDRKEKEQTIVEKKTIKRDLEKENQELEKFKFVLNYKIKELKHEKDPKENKLQTLEKQAKDMDRVRIHFNIIRN